ENLFRVKKPTEWELAQMVTLIDASTFENYLTNMRNLMTEGPKLADLVIFNRCNDETPKSSYRRIIKGMNNTCNILFENLDGTSDDGVGEEDLPYDMKADVIEIKDDQFGIWYIDCMEHPARYNERRIRVKGMGFRLEDLPRKTYVFGRYAMTCCADDIGGIGFICRYKEKFPKEKEWFYLNAKIEAAYSEIHGRAAVILVEESREKAEKPEEELVYFG
ncbi:MAG: GTPase, partial [Clostridia bacterium]|nr:GTPase [Clostridia bacterium]